MKPRIHIVLAVLMGLWSCNGNEGTAEKINAPRLFTGIPAEDSGLDFINHIEETREINYYNYTYLYNGGGVGIADINNDDLPDIYFSSTLGQDKLFLNKGGFQFEDISIEAGITGFSGHKTGISFTDINNDGWMDIYVCRSGWTNDPRDLSNLLFINNKDNSFTEKAEEYNLNDPAHSVQAVFFDYDNDGDNDMYLMNHPSEFKQLLTDMLVKIDSPAYHDSDKLYENTGHGRFVDITEKAGVKNYGYGLGLVASDFNNDGWTDIYVANDFAPHDFYYLNNGNGTFTESLQQYFPHCSYFSMGADITDINEDGFMDLFVVEMLSEDNVRQKTNMAPMDMDRFDYMVDNGLYYQYMRNVFQINNGNGYFSDIAYHLGIDKTDWSWGTLFGDYDNDGDDDLLVANGYLRDTQDKDFSNKSNELAEKFDNKLTFEQAYSLLKSTPLSNYAFRYDGDYKFTTVSEEWGFDFSGYSNGMAYGDLDADGDLDVVVNNINDHASLYKNNTDNDNYILIDLEGPENDLLGLNSKLVVYFSDGSVKNKEFQLTRGFQSSVDPLIHIGVAEGLEVDSIHVNWHKGITKSYSGITKANKHSLKYNTGKIIHPVKEDKEPIFIADESSGLVFNHKEQIYDDYKDQVLLPHKLSQLGPALATGDVNNDGLEDLYIGGAHKQAGELWLQNADGSFTKSVTPAFNADAGHEDVEAVFFDADGDRSPDLYVVSGSYEFAEVDPLLQDRLYLNDGKGKFKKANERLPVILNNGGCVAAGDYDGDGDIDLFVGSRLIHNKYPSTPQSYLLENKDGVFTNVTAQYKVLAEAGMLNAALWTDFDGDNDLDLMTVGEWTDILVFQNNGNDFKRTILGGTDQTGWWNCIEEADLNGDGLTDYILGNLGDNYKYQASEEKPFEVFAGDFDNNDQQDIVVCYYSGEKLYPVRGFQCSSEQIPDLKNKFDSYESFGKADMFDVYGEALDTALHFKAFNFSSVILWGKGKGNYELQLLPAEAQFFPVQDIIVEDFTGDGLPDILLAGNWFVSEIETPRADSGTGLLLENKGHQKFESRRFLDTGFFANGDVRNMAIIRKNASPGGRIIVANNNSALQIFNFTLIDHPQAIQ